jgi:hypothetical protein
LTRQNRFSFGASLLSVSVYRKQLTIHEIKRVADKSKLGAKMAGVAIAATNKLSHRLAALRVTDFSASSSVKDLDATPFSSYDFLHSPKTPRC